jgi:hypothetical protein
LHKHLICVDQIAILLGLIADWVMPRFDPATVVLSDVFHCFFFGEESCNASVYETDLADA